MRILGLDVGEKIGVAISDGLGITAQGIEVIECKNHGKDIDRMSHISDFKVDKIVVGLLKNEWDIRAKQ